MKHLSFLAIALGVVGCQAPQNITTEKVIERPAQTIEAAATSTQGTVDGGGGGNGVEGKPLESYRIDMTQSELVKARVKPILEQLYSRDPFVARNLSHILASRAWYFVPAKLDGLPSSAIGTYFVTDQYAVQNHREVWVNLRDFESMTPDDQVNLIVHEMVMGFRLLRFASALEYCLAAVGNPKLIESLGEESVRSGRSSCYKRHSLNNVFRAESPLNLGKEDYQLIRDLAFRLLSSGGDVDPEELNQWLDNSPFPRP